ncbi:MAG: acyl-CoA dehydrogenase [Myxococcales bacterium]|nr:acyl-CoA dehydrogenase [Myxococcales bacterium]
MAQIQELNTEIPAAYRTDERVAIQEMAREFAMNEVLPVANELDPVQGTIPDDLRKKMGELGFFGIMIPEEHGGLGLGVFEYVLVTEELSRAWMSVASIIARAMLVNVNDLPLEDRDERIRQVARGEFLGCFAMSEPGAGSDIASVRCRADLDGDEWVINGQKMWVTFADGADFIILVARTQPYDREKRHAGIKQFYIPKAKGSFPDGISGTPMRKIGYHGWKTWELSFDNFRIPKDYVIGRSKDASDDQEGFRKAARLMAVPRVHTAARAIGLARGAVEDCITYSQERVQFDQPISDFQAIRFKIATMATEVEAARALMYSVANDADNGLMRAREAAMVKLFASEMAERVTSEGLQIYGGAGYTTEYPIERYWRDARLTKIFEGTSEIQQRIISDSLLPKPPKPQLR